MCFVPNINKFTIHGEIYYDFESIRRKIFFYDRNLKLDDLTLCNHLRGIGWGKNNLYFNCFFEEFSKFIIRSLTIKCDRKLTSCSIDESFKNYEFKNLENLSAQGEFEDEVTIMNQMKISLPDLLTCEITHDFYHLFNMKENSRNLKHLDIKIRKINKISMVCNLKLPNLERFAIDINISDDSLFNKEITIENNELLNLLELSITTNGPFNLIFKNFQAPNVRKFNYKHRKIVVEEYSFTGSLNTVLNDYNNGMEEKRKRFGITSGIETFSTN